MESCNIILLILEFLFLLFFGLFFYNFLLEVQNRHSLIRYFFEYSKSLNNNSSQRSILYPNDNPKRPIIANDPMNNNETFINFVLSNVFSDFHYIFRLFQTNEKVSSFAITKKMAFFLMFSLYFMLFELVILCFQSLFSSEYEAFRFVFLMTLALSLFFSIFNLFLVKSHRETSFSANSLKNPPENSCFSDTFPIFCMISQAIFFFFAIYSLIFGQNLSFSIFSYIIFAFLLESLFFRVIFCLLFCLLFFLKIQAQKMPFSDYLTKENLEENIEKDMKSQVLEFINPKSHFFPKGDENIGVFIDGQAQEAHIYEIKEKGLILRPKTENVQYFDEDEKKQNVHRHNNNKSLVLAKKIFTKTMITDDNNKENQKFSIVFQENLKENKENLIEVDKKSGISIENDAKTGSFNEKSIEKGSFLIEMGSNSISNSYDDVFLRKIKENLEEENLEIPDEFLNEIETNNQLEEFEDEGHFHIFKKKIKDLKKKLMAIEAMISNCQGKDLMSLRKKAYLEEIKKKLEEIN